VNLFKPICGYPGCKKAVLDECIDKHKMPTCTDHRKPLQVLTMKYNAFAKLVLTYLTVVVNYLKAGKPTAGKKGIQEAHANIVRQTQAVLDKEEQVAKDEQRKLEQEVLQEVEQKCAGAKAASSTLSSQGVSEAEQSARKLESAASLVELCSLPDAAALRQAAKAHRSASKLPASVLQLSDGSMCMLSDEQKKLFSAVRVSLSMPATFYMPDAARVCGSHVVQAGLLLGRSSP